jgi:hypothetical protein
MLLPDNVHPNNTVYYNAVFVLQALQKQTKQGIFDLYENTTSRKNISFSLFILCLDWLYLIDVALLNKNGEVELCS